MKRTLIIASIALPAFAAAQITATGPFVGEAHEGWETQPISGPHQTLPMFGGIGSVTTGAPSFMITNSWTLFSTIGPHQGAQFMASIEGSFDFHFATPALMFGGYFGTVTNEPGAFATFFDESNNQIGSSMAIGAPDAAWEWAGWESTVGISRVHISAASSFGHLVTDSLEFSSVPEPAALFGMGLGVGYLLLRRRGR